MLEELGTAIDNLDIPLDGDTIAAAISWCDRLQARIAAAVAAYEAAGQHEIDGATSMPAWLIDRGRMTRGGAGTLARRSRLIAKLPDTRSRWLDGTLSSGHVEAISNNLDSDTVEVFADHETDLLPTLGELSANDAATVMRAWRDIATADREPPPDRPQRLHLSHGTANRWRLDGDLDGETGELLYTALRLATTDDVDGEPQRSVATRRADALADVCRYFLDHRGGAPTGARGRRERPHLNLIVDGDRLADHQPTPGEAPDGVLFDHETLARLLCDCAVHRVAVKGRSAILDYGRTTRTVSIPLWSSLVVRDRHCRFPGCDRPPQWCDAHHVWAWEDGGPTELANLVLLCVRHHKVVHKKTWKAKLLPDATLEATDPKGRVRTSRPPGTKDPWPGSKSRATAFPGRRHVVVKSAAVMPSA